MDSVTRSESPHDPYANWPARYTGRRAMGYLCTRVPEEIIHAAGFAPIRIMPSTRPPVRADAHLQSYTCSLARSCLDEALSGKLSFLEGVLFAHTCDTMQGLADIWHAAFPDLYVDTVVGPIDLSGPHARAYLVAELRRFIRSLEQHFAISISDDALRASIRLYNERRRRLADFYSQRESHTAVEWLDLMTAALTTPPEQPLALLPPRDLPARRSARLILVGSTIDEPTLLQILDELQVQVVADDFCNGARYFDTAVAEEGDPVEALADRELARLVCPCKHRGLDGRANHLLELVKRHRADGVILFLKKFCDPHAWDAVPLAAALEKARVRHLVLETEQVAPAGQTRVRVEAFVEMLDA